MKNPYRKATIVLGIILLFFFVINIIENPPEKTVRVGEMQIRETDMKSFLSIYGTEPFQLCNIQNKQCIEVAFAKIKK